MKLTARKTSAGIAAVATAGVSTLFMGAAPASAATETCGDVGTLVEPGVCELVFTEGTGTFTPTGQMTKLEVLLVGAGGAAAVSAPGEGTNGYAAAGGGGQVRVVDLSGNTEPIEVTVPAPNAPGSIEVGGVTENVANGLNGQGITDNTSGSGGDSGSGEQGATFSNTPGMTYGGGGGDDGAASGANGGAGSVVNTLSLVSDSLFANDTRCFGGGGAAGIAAFVGDPGYPAVAGVAGCGGGAPTDATATGLAAPVPNSGGGAGAIDSNLPSEQLAGAAGLVAIRWNSWTVLPATGGGLNPAAVTIGAAALLAGVGLAAAAGIRRKRAAD